MTNRLSAVPPRFLWTLALLALLVAACTPGSQPVIPSPQPNESTPSAAESPIPSPTPTATSQPDRIALFTDSPDDSTMLDLQAKLQESATQNGLQFDVLSSAEAAGLDEHTKLAVFANLPEQLETLVTASPLTQFLVVSQAEVNPSPNLSVIRLQPADRAFLAGMIAEMLSSDWRGGGLFPAEQPEIAGAFQNGGHYLCGRCVPIYAPVILFPLTGTAPSGSSEPAWQGAFDELQMNRIETLYLSPEAQSPELISYLVDKKITLIGGQTPGETVPAQWAATLQYDLTGSIQALIPDLLAGNGGKTANAKLYLSDVNPELITAGKMQQIQQVMDDLAAGWLNPLPVPTE